MRFLLPLLLLPSMAQAGEDTCRLLCGPSERVHEGLTAAGEEVVGRGVTGGGALLTLYTARDGGAFTVIITLPSGDACALAAGIAWERVTPGQKI